jgi:hypothetical protein
MNSFLVAENELYVHTMNILHLKLGDKISKKTKWPVYVRDLEEIMGSTVQSANGR